MRPPPYGKSRYKVGIPYEINGQWYYPKEDFTYDETGLASWYGADFHNKKTANGELFDQNALTAAHKTLPLPTLARVTNLENGRAVVVRINDRGPFVGLRIIDVSRRVAELLGFANKGVAKVRVQVLEKESRAIAEALGRWETGTKVDQSGASSSQADALNRAQLQRLNPMPALNPPPVPSISAQKDDAVSLPSPLPDLESVKPLPIVRQMPVEQAGILYVQVGAFSDPVRARRLQESLQKFGTVTLAEVTRNGQTLTRVRIGPVNSVKEADQMVRRVHKAGYVEARTIVE